MSLEIWLAFILAATIVLVIPGPTIIFVMGQAIVYGSKSVVPLVAGVALGDLTAMTMSLVGLGGVLAASAAAFTVLKMVGACYLVYLGIVLFRTKPEKIKVSNDERGFMGRALFKRAYIITALNPKSIVFFVAFMPQFVSGATDAGHQLLVLGATFLILATINACLYAIFAGQFHELLKSRKLQRIFSSCGGSALVGAGIFTAVSDM